MTTEADTPPKKRGGRKPGSKNRCSANTISFDMRVAIMASLNALGKGRYLVKLAKEEPMAYATLLRAVLKNNDSDEAQGLTIVVQQLPPSTQPIPGVINSPIAAHIAPPRLVANHGTVIDAETVRLVEPKP